MLARAAAKVAAVKRERTALSTRSGLTLVVDDDEEVMNVVSTMIEDLGFFVLRALAGTEALGVLEAHPEILLLVTDIVMPGMDGWELARAARQRNPEIKVLYMSGYIENRTALPAEEYGPVLPKPGRTQQLYEAMARALAAP